MIINPWETSDLRYKSPHDQLDIIFLLLWIWYIHLLLKSRHVSITAHSNLIHITFNIIFWFSYLNDYCNMREHRRWHKEGPCAWRPIIVRLSSGRICITFRRRYFRTYFPQWKCMNFEKISLTFVLKGPINNIQAFVNIMAWCCPDDKPISDTRMLNLLVNMDSGNGLSSGSANPLPKSIRAHDHVDP